MPFESKYSIAIGESSKFETNSLCSMHHLISRFRAIANVYPFGYYESQINKSATFAEN